MSLLIQDSKNILLTSRHFHKDSISSNKIKENIIINEISSIKDSYSFEISAEGLTGIVENDNSVSFENANEEKVFYIPAPFMKDSLDTVSMDIEISLYINEIGKYVLTYYPNMT